MPRAPRPAPMRSPDAVGPGLDEASARATPPVRGADVAVAVASWVLAATALVSLPALADLDPETVTRVPRALTPTWWLGLGVVSLQAAALAWRRRHPGAVLLAVAAGVPLAAAAGLADALGTTTVAVLVAAYSVAVAGPLRGGAPALAGATVLVAAGTLLSPSDPGAPWLVDLGSALVQGVGTIGLAVVAGVVVGTRRDAAEARTRQAWALRREHEARVQAAVAQERTAMARELHDIAAHHLSGIAVMAGAIGRQIDADPEAAKDAVRQVRAETTAMLEELRHLVRLLRDAPTADRADRADRADAPDGPDAPDAAGTTDRADDAHVETLASVPGLVERVRAAGVDATLTVLGAADDRPPVGVVGPLAQLAAYRTVQECLANVVRHAPGSRCEVVLDARDPATLVVSVRNGPPARTATPAAPPGDGLGLVGMQERADLTDAHLDYGPQPDGGWLVTLALPVGGATGPAPTEGATA